jgi:hypothetical protein
MGTVKTEGPLWRASMQEKTRRTVGYAAVGFALGFFLFPWFYIWSTRWGPAERGNPVWTLAYMGIILVPALLFAWMGPRRGDVPA